MQKNLRQELILQGLAHADNYELPQLKMHHLPSIIKGYKKSHYMDKRIFIVLLFSVGCETTPELIVHQGYALGTSYSAQYQEIDVDYETVQAGIDSIFYVVNKSLSTYLPDSDISQPIEGTVLVDHHFKAVFNKANRYKTQGLFDPTVGAWEAYGFGPEKS